MRIYVASSWRNMIYEEVVQALKDAGQDVYDFRNPCEGYIGFHWSEVDPAWKTWSPQQYKDGLCHERAEQGYRFDKNAIDWANCGVLVMPCGLSAHLEAGYLAGQGKPVLVYMPEHLPVIDTTYGRTGLIEKLKFEPELMYKLLLDIHFEIDTLVEALRKLDYLRKDTRNARA